MDCAIMSGGLGEPAKIIVTLSQEFFRLLCRGSLEKKLIWLSACSSMSQSDPDSDGAKELVDDTSNQSLVLGYTDTAITFQMAETEATMAKHFITESDTLQESLTTTCGAFSSQPGPHEDYAPACPGGTTAEMTMAQSDIGNTCISNHQGKDKSYFRGKPDGTGSCTLKTCSDECKNGLQRGLCRWCASSIKQSLGVGCSGATCQTPKIREGYGYIFELDSWPDWGDIQNLHNIRLLPASE